MQEGIAFLPEQAFTHINDIDTEDLHPYEVDFDFLETRLHPSELFCLYFCPTKHIHMR